MSASLKELLQQREALEKAIADARQNEISAAVTQVRELIAEYGLTVQDVFPGRAGIFFRRIIRLLLSFLR